MAVICMLRFLVDVSIPVVTMFWNAGANVSFLSRPGREELAATRIQSSFRGHYIRRTSSMGSSATSFDFDASNSSLGYAPHNPLSDAQVSPSALASALSNTRGRNWGVAIASGSLIGTTLVTLSRRNSEAVDEDDGIASGVIIRGFGGAGGKVANTAQ